eukprot:13323685-Heterocapsa_arctica.AAC.1
MPLFEASMKMDWWHEVYMTDSCVDGAGVISTTATVEEIVEEARFAETGLDRLATGRVGRVRAGGGSRRRHAGTGPTGAVGAIVADPTSVLGT